MNSVLHPLTKPVHGERDVHRQSDNLGGAARAVARGIDPIAARFIGDVNRDESDREPRGKSSRDNSS